MLGALFWVCLTQRSSETGRLGTTPTEAPGPCWMKEPGSLWELLSAGVLDAGAAPKHRLSGCLFRNEAGLAHLLPSWFRSIFQNATLLTSKQKHLSDRDEGAGDKQHPPPIVRRCLTLPLMDCERQLWRKNYCPQLNSERMARHSDEGS